MSTARNFKNQTGKALAFASTFSLKLAFTLASVATALVIGSAQLAQARTSRPEECSFVPREAVKEIMEKLPAQVIGWANCFERHPETSVFIVAKFAKNQIDDASLDAFLLNHAKQVVHDQRESKIVWKTLQAIDRRQVIIQTKGLLPSDMVTHFAFTTRDDDGGIVLFVHSLGERETQLIRPTLDMLRDRLVKSDFLDTMKADRSVAGAN